MFCCGQIELAAGWGSTLSDLNDYLNVSYSGNETQLYVPSVLLRNTHTHIPESQFLINQAYVVQMGGEGGKEKEEGAGRGKSDDTPNRWILRSSTWVPDEVILLWDTPFLQALWNLELNKCIIWGGFTSLSLCIHPAFPLLHPLCPSSRILNVSFPLCLEKWESEGSESSVTEHQTQPNSF